MNRLQVDSRFSVVPVLLLAIILCISGCGSSDDSRINAKDVRNALAETGLRIESKPFTRYPKRLGITDTIAGTAYDSKGYSVPFVWTIWKSPAAIDRNANWEPRLGGDIYAHYTYGNARLFTSFSRASRYQRSDSSAVEERKNVVGTALIGIERKLGHDVLEKVSPYKSDGV